jgi:hypothetical protein
LLLILSLLALSVPALADGTRGGGNTEEAEFIAAARAIRHKALLDERGRRVLGLELRDFDEAIDGTQVQCAFGGMLARIRSLRKLAYYEPDQGIFLDCPKWKDTPNDLSRDILVLHEYMRKLGRESSDYKVSSHLPEAYEACATPERKDEPAKPLAFEGDGIVLKEVARKVTVPGWQKATTTTCDLYEFDYTPGSGWQFFGTANDEDCKEHSYGPNGEHRLQPRNVRTVATQPDLWEQPQLDEKEKECAKKQEALLDQVYQTAAVRQAFRTTLRARTFEVVVNDNRSGGLAESDPQLHRHPEVDGRIILRVPATLSKRVNSETHVPEDFCETSDIYAIHREIERETAMLGGRLD